MSSPGKTFDGLLEALPDALIGIDESGVIRFVNRQTESLFGYGRDEVVGGSLEMLVPEAPRQSHEADRQLRQEDPATRPMAESIRPIGRRRDGTTFPADVLLSQLDTGDAHLTIAAVRDMTQYNPLGPDRRRARSATCSRSTSPTRPSGLRAARNRPSSTVPSSVLRSAAARAEVRRARPE